LRLHFQERITLDLTLQSLVRRPAVDRADVVVLCRHVAPKFARILRWVEETGRPLIYELDDNLLDIPQEIPGLDYARDPASRAALIACIRRADVVHVYSPTLQECVSSYNPSVRVVTGPLDWGLIPDTLPARDPRRMRLVYATSRRQDRIASMVVGPLLRALDQFPQTEVTVWGPRIGALERHPRVRHLAVIADYDRFVSHFVREAFDIGLAPLPNDQFHRCKSNNKFREYASCGVAGIYSDMPVYNQSIVDGDTGLLAGDGEEAWFRALQRLIADASLRDRVVHNARRYARCHFNQETTDAEWMASIAPLTERRRERAVATPAGGQASGMRDVLTHASELTKMVLASVRDEGLRVTAGRVSRPLLDIVQLAAWEIRRWRLQPRAGARRGRS
jgi:hypothetical protein